MQTPCSWLLYDQALDVPPESGTFPTVNHLFIGPLSHHILEIGLKSIRNFWSYFVSSQTNAGRRRSSSLSGGNVGPHTTTKRVQRVFVYVLIKALVESSTCSGATKCLRIGKTKPTFCSLVERDVELAKIRR